MSDTDPVRFEGYAFTYAGSTDSLPRAELERLVAQRSTVPLRVNFQGPVLGQAQLSVDDTGLKVSATLAPSGWRQLGVDEGVPYGEAVHTTAAPEALRRATASLSAVITESLGIGEVSIVTEPGEKP